MRTRNARATFYSIAGVSLYGVSGPLGYVEVPGSLDLSSGVAPEKIITRGGFSALPQTARGGIQSGEATLTLNECPAWLEAAAGGGSMEAIAAAASGTIGAVNGVAGTGSLNTLAVTAEPGAGALTGGVYWVTADGTDIKVEAHTTNGQWAFSGAASAELNLAGLGIKVDATALTIASGDRAMFVVTPPHQGGEKVSFPTQPRYGEYTLRAYSVAKQSPQDALIAIDIKRVMLLGFNPKLEDNVATNGVEIALQILDPLDGTEPWSITHLEV